MNDHPKKRWGCLQWGVVGVVVILLCMLLIPQPTVVSKVSAQMRAVSNAKQVIIAMKEFASENDSRYPDAPVAGFTPVSSNQIFRRLFQKGVTQDERIFGCPEGGFVPDTRIGSAPHFDQALQPGECHWMLLKGQSDTSFGDVPLIIENALDTSIPPRWELSPQSPAQRGRAWKGGMIIVGLNDGSVQVRRLGPDGRLDDRGTASDWNWMKHIPPAEAAVAKYWDIEDRK